MRLAKRILSSILSVSLTVTSLAGIALATKEETKAKVKDSYISVSVRKEENSVELDTIFKECKKIKSDGSSVELKRGQMTSVSSASFSIGVSAAIMSNGDLYCWGANSSGQIGNSSKKIQTTPVKVLGDVSSISISGYSPSSYENYATVAAITSNGDLYCWGENSSGQVGNGTQEDQTTPVKVLNDVSSVFVSVFNDPYSDGSGTVTAIKKNGDLYCWGDNRSGQIGNGTRENQSTPIKVLNDVSFVSIPDKGHGTIAAIKTNGDLYSWGTNRVGQVGNGTQENQTTPIRVLDNVGFVSIFGVTTRFYDYVTVAAIKKNGDLYCWGANDSGQVGNGTQDVQTMPVKVLDDVNSISASVCGNYSDGLEKNYGTVAAIKNNGDLYCWGDNQSGQIGNGTQEDQTTPTKVLNDVNFVSICVSTHWSNHSYHYCYGTTVAIKKNGDLYCWGNNDSGQIGNGTQRRDQTTPTKVLSNVSYVSIYIYPQVRTGPDGAGFRSIGAGTVVAIKENGDLYCWGENWSGQVGNSEQENDQTMPTKVLNDVQSVYISGYNCGTVNGDGNATIIAIKKNGDLYCWGENRSGQIGNGTRQNQSTPIKILPIDDSPSQNPQADETKFLVEHLSFVHGLTYPERMKSTWAGVISKGLDTPTGRFGETMYNVLNTGSEILSCKRLKIFENPYDAVIMDLILDQSDVKLKDFSLDFSTEFSKNVSLVEKLCSMSKYKDDWVLEEEKYKTQLERLIESPKSMKESNPAFYELCNKIFSSIDEKEMDKILNAYGKASQLQSALNTYANVVEWVADCIKFNSLVKAYIDTSMEFKQTLQVAAVIMSQNMDDPTKKDTLSRPGYVAFYEEAVNKYTDFLTEDRIVELLFTEYTVNGLKRVADVFGNVIVKNATLYLSVGLGISKAAASWLYACIEAYKTGWRISEAITLNGENIECRELARASYYLEEALIEIVEDTAIELKDKKSIQAAKNFDAAYTILQDLECYALNNYARYLEVQQESFVQSVIQTIIHGVNFNKAEIEEVKALELEWKNACCHKDVKNSKDIGKVKTVTNVTVCCPTDVYVYDKEDNIVLSIENSIVTKDTREVSGETVGDIKLISLFDISDYNIEIKATDNGSMSVVSDTYDLKEEKSGKSFSYIDIPIEKNTAYTLDDTHLLDGDGVIEPTVELAPGKDKTMVTSIALDKDGGVLKIGDEINIKASVSPADVFCPVVSWSTSDKDIAAVSEDGRLTAKRGGKVTVICSAIDGSGTSSSIEYNIKAGIYFESNGGSVKEPELYDVGEKVNVPSAVERAGYSFKGWYIDKELTKKFEVGVMPDQDIILYAGWTKNGGNNVYIPTVPSTPNITPQVKPTASPQATAAPSFAPTASPTVKPTTVPTTVPTSVPTETPEPTLKPTETPKATIKPSAKPKPSARPGTKDEDKTNSAKKIKKGSKVTDKKTKAVYKVTGTGKNRTAEYTKSTGKNPSSISIPASVKLGGKNYKVTSVGKAAFKNNKKLKTVKLGKNVKKIGQQAFYGCTRLTKVSLGKNVTAIGANAFNECTALTIITIPSKVNKIGTKAFYQCRKLRYFMVKTKKLTLENIGANAFGSGYSSPRVKTDKGIWKRYSNVFLLRGMSKKALFVIDPVKLVI